jgi:hypothetical protein
MRGHTKRQTGRFTARDHAGNVYTVYIFTEYSPAGTRDDPHAMLEGMKELQVADGSPVNRKQQGEYEIVSTGVILRSDDPKAP